MTRPSFFLPIARLAVLAATLLLAGAGHAGEVSPAVAVSGAVSRPVVLDLAALQALPASTQTAGGREFTGVSLWTVLKTVTGLKTGSEHKSPTVSMYLVATGTDGYRAVVSLGEMDPDFGNRTVLLAYAVDGAPLGVNGMARLLVAGDARQGRSVANLKSIEVFTASPGP